MMQQNQFSRLYFVAGSAIAFLIIALSIYSKSFWGDEIWSIVCSESTWENLIHTLAKDSHPPLYFVILKVWISLFGDSEISVRIFQGVQCCGLIFSTMFLFKEICGKYCHPLFIAFVFSSNLWLLTPMVRYYSLAAILVVLATICLFRCVEDGSSRNFTMIMIHYAAILYTDYPASGIIAIHALYIFFFHREYLKIFCKFLLLSLLLFVPWMLVLIGQIVNLSMATQIADFNPSSKGFFLKIVYSLYVFLFGETVFPFETILFFVAISMMISILVERKFLGKILLNPHIYLLLFLIIGSLIFTSIITTFIARHTSFIYTPARTFFVLPFIFVFLGGLYSLFQKKWTRIVFVFSLLLINIYGNINWVFNRHFIMPVYASPWKEMMASLHEVDGAIIADESSVYRYYQNHLPGKYPSLIDSSSISHLEKEISNHNFKKIAILVSGRDSTRSEIPQELMEYIRSKWEHIDTRKYMIIDKRYRKLKEKILARDSYDAKFSISIYRIKD
jgi:uncharacterized membrane protein